MGLNQMGGSPSKGINGLSLAPILKADPSKELWVRNIKNGQKYRLKLNFRGELCYQDGNSLKLILKSEESLYELLDDKKNAESDEETESCTIGDITTSRLDFHTLVYGLNVLIEETANIGKPWYEYKDDQDKRIESVAVTEFKVNVPPDIEEESLAKSYYQAITRSLWTKQARLRLKQRHADKIKTCGYVRNIPSMLAILQKLLVGAGINSTCLTPTGPYLKMEFWKKGDI